MKKQNVFKMASFIMTATLILSACSQSTGGSSATPAASNGPGSTAFGTGAEIPYGYLGGFTGWLSPFTEENIKSVELAVNEVNNAGGILDGKKLKLYTQDSASTVEGSIKGFQKLVTSNKVVTIQGVDTDGMLALMKDAKNYKVPVTSQYAGSIQLDSLGGDYAYRTAPSDTLLGVITSKELIAKGLNEVAIMTENYEGALSEAEKFKQLYEAAGGKVLTEVKFNSNQNTYQAELSKIAAVKPKLVYYAGGPTAGTLIFKGKFERNYDWNWVITPDISTQDLIDSTGADVLKGAIAFQPMDDTKSDTFIRFSKAYKDANGKEPQVGMYNAHAYDLVILSALAMEAGKDASGKAINDNIRKVSGAPGKQVKTFEEGVKELRAGNDIDYVGASGPVDMDEKGNVLSSYGLFEVKNGKWEPTEFYPADALK